MAIKPVYYREGQPFDFSQNTYNPCCMIASRSNIFPGFARQLRSYAGVRGANVNKAIAQIRKF